MNTSRKTCFAFVLALFCACSGGSIALQEDASTPDSSFDGDVLPLDGTIEDASFQDRSIVDADQHDSEIQDSSTPDAVSPDSSQPDSTIVCIDTDGDEYGEGCILGPDCDDNAPGIVGPCQTNGCPQSWVYIPAGDFEMGCNEFELDDTCALWEGPRHTVTLSAYCINISEINVGLYRWCKNGGVCTGTPATTDSYYNWSDQPGSRELHPMNGINWSEAQQYCQDWVGGDLPTEAQWEKAARGGPNDLRKYPWGNSPDPDCIRANGYYNSTYCNLVTPPGTWTVVTPANPDGDSPYGLKNMAGNVLEWVRDWYSTTFYQQCAYGCTDPLNTTPALSRSIRGGSYHSTDFIDFRTVARGALVPIERISYVGFRCVRSLP